MKEVVKEWLSELLGPAFPWIKENLISPIYYVIAGLWTPGANIFVPYLLTAIGLSLIVYRWQEARSQRLSFRQFFRYLVPSNVYLHKSAVLDYKFVFVKALVSRLLFGGASLGFGFWLAAQLSSLLEGAFGANPLSEPTFVARAVFTISVALAVEFGHYAGHYLEHRVPLLWEFHKTHHSCEVLTPISVYRNHPVDEVVKAVILSICSGAVVGIYTYLYPGGILEYTVLNVGVVFFISYLAANLLHSHVWLSYGWRMNHVLVSPCMHQIHHSSEPRHFDRNFGNFFAFWDWLFGTLYVPRHKETFALGISNNQHLEFNSVWNLYFVPFKNAFRLLRGRQSTPVGGQAAESIAQP
jgi:sterol desaturase/sphingolipid hydroxylase (fatty acid hydroxylase superfamily)